MVVINYVIIDLFGSLILSSKAQVKTLPGSIVLKSGYDMTGLKSGYDLIWISLVLPGHVNVNLWLYVTHHQFSHWQSTMSTLSLIRTESVFVMSPNSIITHQDQNVCCTSQMIFQMITFSISLWYIREMRTYTWMRIFVHISFL